MYWEKTKILCWFKFTITNKIVLTLQNVYVLSVNINSILLNRQEGLSNALKLFKKIMVLIILNTYIKNPLLVMCSYVLTYFFMVLSPSFIKKIL